jgi:hypothetical protein
MLLHNRIRIINRFPCKFINLEHVNYFQFGPPFVTKYWYPVDKSYSDPPYITVFKTRFEIKGNSLIILYHSLVSACLLLFTATLNHVEQEQESDLIPSS